MLVDPHEIRTKYGIEIADLWGAEFTEFYRRLYRDAADG